MKRRPLIVTSAALIGVLALAVAAEFVVRHSIDARLAAAPVPFSLRLSSPSALVALVTGHVSVTASLTPDDASSLLSARLPGAGDVELAEGAVGMGMMIGGQEATAWVSLTAVDGAITADVDTLEVAGLRIDPAMLLGEDVTTLTLANPVSECPGAAVSDIRVTPPHVNITVEASRDALACLSQST
ncbi:hypothetical protein [Demequina sp. NBRC 110052]|uniref:hypothetical protein n=1 Tax=Demequina sp. NBRC 110052 TaxID=1570341 RepID=UPI000A050E5D|nr:hypothetical protein [Demequina sp. NBRC 110052]